MFLHPLIQNAGKVLAGEPLSETEALTLAEEISGSDILDLVSLANKVRDRFAPGIVPCSIINGQKAASVPRTAVFAPSPASTIPVFKPMPC